MFSKSSIVGNTDPFIEINLSLEGNSTDSTTLHLVIYGFGDEDLFGKYFGEEYKLCNNSELVVDTNTEPTKNFVVQSFSVPDGNAIYREKITETGFYSLFLVKCDENNEALTINGDITFQNPYGHLRGEYYGFLPLFGALLVIYAVIAVIWIVLCVVFRRKLLRLQLMLGGIIGLALLECILLEAEFGYMNTSGRSSMIFFTVTSLGTLARQACSRIVILTVALGYGVARASLSKKEKLCIGGYFVVYLLTFILFNIGRILHMERQISDFVYTTVFTLPSSLADAGLYTWIFIALWNTISALKKKKQTAKSRMYRILMGTLITYFVISFFWTIIQLFVLSTSLIYVLWPGLWLAEGFWHLSFLCIFVVILYLWRPNTHNKRYAYSEQLDVDNDDNEEAPDVQDTSIDDQQL